MTLGSRAADQPLTVLIVIHYLNFTISPRPEEWRLLAVLGKDNQGCEGLRRTNTIVLVPTPKQSQHLYTIADACPRLWTEINYRRRQSFFAGAINGAVACPLEVSI